MLYVRQRIYVCACIVDVLSFAADYLRSDE
jgi:hypothetical protein